MATKPTKPTQPLKASRLDRDTFQPRADATVDYLFGTVPDYVDESNTFIDGRAEDALAAALGGDLPPITGKAGQFLRVNAGETAAEFAAVDLTKATEAEAEAGTGTGLMDPVLTKAAIEAQELQVGVGQTWQDLTASRAHSTSYQNTTGKPIMVAILAETGTSRDIEVSVDNVVWVRVGIANKNATISSPFIVPNNYYYRINGAVSASNWSELR